MRAEYPAELEHGRIVTGTFASKRGDAYGAFQLLRNGKELRILAATAEDPVVEGWEHVSVSTDLRRPPPSWADMCYVKNLFWSEEECVLQFHPPQSVYISNYTNCLHLWKAPYPTPLPPAVLVGIKELGTLD